MRETLLTIVAIFLLFVAFPILILRIRDRIRDRRHRKTPERIEAEGRAYRERLLHPNSMAVEEQLGGRLPDRLVALYADHVTILSKGLKIQKPKTVPSGGGYEWIQEFLPLDTESQRYAVDLVEPGWGNGFCFAGDGCGNFYWVPVSNVRQADAPVFFACHDPWGNEKIADSLEEFLSWPREAGSKR